MTYLCHWACSVRSSALAVRLSAQGGCWRRLPTVTTRHQTDWKSRPHPPYTPCWRLRLRPPQRRSRLLVEWPRKQAVVSMRAALRSAAGGAVLPSVCEAGDSGASLCHQRHRSGDRSASPTQTDGLAWRHRGSNERISTRNLQQRAFLVYIPSANGACLDLV